MRKVKEMFDVGTGIKFDRAFTTVYSPVNNF